MSDATPPPPPSSPPPPPPPGGGAPVDYAGPSATAGVAKGASTFLKIAALLGLVQAVLQLLTAVLPNSIVGGVIGGLLGCLSLLILVGMVAGFVIYLIWQYRAYDAVRRAGQSTTYTPGWSVGWLLIPIANLIFSKTVWSDLWRASGATQSPSPLNAVETPAGGRPTFIYFCFIGFFALFVVGILVGIVAVTAGVAFIGVVGGLLSVVAYLLWVGFAFSLATYVDDVQRALPTPTTPAAPPAPAAPAAPAAQQ